jgi:hypothetical protein
LNWSEKPGFSRREIDRESIVSRVIASRRGFLSSVVAGAAIGAAMAPARISVAAELTRGFEKTLRSYATGEEINRQRNIWVLEVEMKPMRMVFIDSRDPKTGEMKKEQVWYLAYRAINRPLLNRKSDDDTAPVNDIEPLPGPDKFIPAFTLVTYDDPKTEIPVEVHDDVISPQALKQINRIERRSADDPMFLSSVQITQDLPDPVPHGTTDEKWMYGVATFKGVDPNTDFFKVILRGFSNGYLKEDGPDGMPVVKRKVGVQKFIRRGDRFDPNQAEFLFEDNPKWDYQADKERKQS